MKSNKIRMRNNKILLSDIENSKSNTGPDLSFENICSSDYSTLVTSSNINNSKNSKIVRFSTQLPIIKNIAFNTIDENTRDRLYLSKKNIEYNIYLSSLKQNLHLIRKERKESENIVTNLKRKIIELQKEEQYSIKQLENVKKHINNIINNRKKYKIKPKKKLHKRTATKDNISIFKTNENLSPNYELYNNINYTFNNWLKSNKKFKNKSQNFENNMCYNKIKNIDNSFSKTSKCKNKKKISYKAINFNSENPTKFKIKVKLNNKIKEDKKNIQKNNNKNIKENLIKQLKKDKEEQMKIQKQIEQIEKEQNSLFINFYENFSNYRSSKTLDLLENHFKYDI